MNVQWVSPFPVPWSDLCSSISSVLVYTISDIIFPILFLHFILSLVIEQTLLTLSGMSYFLPLILYDFELFYRSIPLHRPDVGTILLVLFDDIILLIHL